MKRHNDELCFGSDAPGIDAPGIDAFGFDPEVERLNACEAASGGEWSKENGPVNAMKLIGAMERFGRVLLEVVSGVSEEDARWKPEHGAPGSGPPGSGPPGSGPPGSGPWSILEVVRHLLDEETEDFRVRLKLTLESPEREWPKIDPQGWAIKRKYNEDDLQDSAKRFADERAADVEWLRSLRNPDWSRAHQHPRFGTIHAGDLLAAWAAHDALHLRQISKRLYQIAQRDGGKYSVRYAGEWTA